MSNVRSGLPQHSRAEGTADTEAGANLPRVLLVDDQIARLLAYEAILSGIGAACVRASSGLEALAALLSGDFAAILLDVNMPGMDGFEVARLVRGRPRTAQIPIIFVTGAALSELDYLRGYELGAIDYIGVPVVPEILRSKVAVLIELHQRRRELEGLNRVLAEARVASERQCAAAMADRDMQLQAIFEHPTDLIVVLGAVRGDDGAVVDFVYRNANTNATRLLGMDRGQLAGRRLHEVIPDRAGDVLRMCTRVLDTRAPMTYEIATRGGSFQITLYPYGDDGVVSSGRDISAHKNLEAALRTSEARLRALLDHAPVGVALNALDGRFEYANRAFCELVGYSAAELQALTWQEITDPADLLTDDALARQAFAGDIPYYTMEKRYLRKDGSRAHVELFGNFVRDAEGRAVQGVGIVIDIGERQRAAQALADSRQRLLLAKSAARLGIWDWDVASGRLDWDERVRELWGVAEDADIDYDVFVSRLHPGDRAAAEAAVQRALDPRGEGHFHSIYRIVPSGNDATACWIEAIGRTSFEAGAAVRMIGTVQDVSARVCAEARLRESEERFRELANNIDQFAWTCDELGVATWYNTRWYEYTGTTFDEMRGEGWRGVHHPDHVDRVAAGLDAARAAGVAWEDTFPLRSRSGDYRWFLSRAVPIRGEDGRVLRWFGTNTDVTEQRALQDALTLADRRKDEFLAMLSHELRNPVAPISTAAAGLRRMLAPGSAEGSLAEIISRQTSHLARLLDDLLDVARITLQRIELRREVLPLQDCIDAAIEEADVLIREKGQHLVVSPAGADVRVEVDRVRLAQCVANLLGNAAKYTDAGGTIALASRADGADAVIDVSDSGMGIAPEFLPHVFDLFAQDARGLDRSQGGLGIGLSICRRIVELHGGRIEARSPGPGRGATFTLRLPLAEALPAVPATTRSGKHRARRVLIVDDNRDAAESLALLLSFDGHETRTEHSGEAALAGAAEFDPQLVLLDIGLPGLDGYAVAARLRSLVPAARIVALTGYGQPEDLRRALAAGFSAHMLKPIAWEALQRVIADS